MGIKKEFIKRFNFVERIKNTQKEEDRERIIVTTTFPTMLQFHFSGVIVYIRTICSYSQNSLSLQDSKYFKRACLYRSSSTFRFLMLNGIPQ